MCVIFSRKITQLIFNMQQELF